MFPILGLNIEDKSQPRCAGAFTEVAGFPLPVSCKETDGSLKFPGYPFEHMPRSQLQTPVVSWSLTKKTLSGLLPSEQLNAVGFLPIKSIGII